MGIVSSDFELLLKKNRTMLNELTDDLSSVKRNFESVVSNFSSKDLKFVVNKLDLEIDQLNKISKKVDAYQDTLVSVCNGYKEQLEQIVRDTNNLIS